MPVRSLNSPVLKWPEAQEVIKALKLWVEQLTKERGDILRVGYFGSYARGDWGVGSDLDLVVIIEKSNQPFERRAAEFDTLQLPVPADLLVYTQEEWKTLRPGKFLRILEKEAVWIYSQKK
ncbi:MAG: nucleotidyltransferase domain-containing protein [Deltaproteobacteria bacterium]|nr:nucleotidyltransferase domain-containing protein [Deltaproteobacteria bacterium]